MSTDCCTRPNPSPNPSLPPSSALLPCLSPWAVSAFAVIFLQQPQPMSSSDQCQAATNVKQRPDNTVHSLQTCRAQMCRFHSKWHCVRIPRCRDLMRKCSRFTAELPQLDAQVGFIVMLFGVCVAWGGCGNSFTKQGLYNTGGSMGATTCCLVLAAGCCLSVLAADCCLVAVVAAATVCR